MFRKLLQSFLVLLFCLSFVLSGLFVNIIQFVLFYTLAYINIDLYRKLNYYLTYTIWSQLVAFGEWWANIDLTLYYADEASSKMIGTRHTMFLMNHMYELDWLIAWLTIDRYNILGNAKSLVKKALKYIPIVGWSWIFGEFPFLDRNIDQDSDKIVKSMTRFIEYITPVSILVFPEATRFTKEKHDNSIKFAVERGLPIYKHHLLPRVKGFNLSVKTFKDKYPDLLICQIELRFSKDSAPPTLMSIVNRKNLKADVYMKYIPLREVPTNSEEDTSNYLYYIYKQKDELVDYHDKNDRFPGIKVKIPARKAPLFNWLTWIGLSTLCVACLLASGSWLMISFTIFLMIIAAVSVNYMISSTQIKYSSDYGTKKSKKDK